MSIKLGWYLSKIYVRNANHVHQINGTVERLESCEGKATQQKQDAT